MAFLYLMVGVLYLLVGMTFVQRQRTTTIILRALRAIAHDMMQARIDADDYDNTLTRDLANACVALTDSIGDGETWGVEK